MNKTFIIAILAIAAVNAMPSNRIFKIRGGVRHLDGDDLKDAENALIFSLEQLSAGEDGPHYTLGKVNSATKQLVSGSLYKINADIIDAEENTKNCNIKIWSQPWLDDGIEVTFACEDEELSPEEANETLTYVLSKYEGVEMKIIGQPISIYGLRLSHNDNEEELNIHFKYIDNTQQDIIQNCVFALYRRQKECELIRTICNTFLPITPRPLLQRNELRVCNDGSDVQLIEKEDFEEDTEETSPMTTTDAEQVDADTEQQEAQQKQQSAQEQSDEGDDAAE